MNNKIFITKSEINKKNFLNLYYEYISELNEKKSINSEFKKKLKIKLSKKKNLKIFIIKYGNVEIGILNINFSYNILSKKVCYINDFYIKKNFRKKNLAKKTMTKFIKSLKIKSIKELRLEIINKNELAYNFWKKFKLIKKSTNYSIKIK